MASVRRRVGADRSAFGAGGAGTEAASGSGVTAPRIVAPGATYAVTRRCVCRKAFLGWWHPEVDDVFFWCLAVVAEKCGVRIHHAVRVGSHYHMTFTLTGENLGEFLQRLHHQMSRMLNALLEREGYDPPRELFDARGTHVMRLMDAEAQLAHIVYERVNPPAAGLAETCDGVPGQTLDLGRWKGAGMQLTRPRVAKSGGDSQVMQVTPPALLYRAFAGDVDRLVHHAGKMEREAERAIRAARKGPPRTADEVRAIHPWDEPLTLRESGGRVPSFKTGLVGLEGKEARIRGAKEVRGFREAHAAANERWCGGDRGVEYPYGTYEMRRFHGAEVADPAPDAWVSAPGPTLEEVQAELERGEVEAEEDLVDRVREAVVQGAEAMVAEEGDAEEGEDAEADQRPAPERHHRFTQLPTRQSDEQPRRLIRLRDDRRRRGSDPPED